MSEPTRFHSIVSTVLSALLVAAINLTKTKSSYAQDLDNVTLTGRVLDQNGAIIPGVRIEAIVVKTGATRITLTDSEGRYRIIQLEPGLYKLRASVPGFAPLERNDVGFVAGRNIQLELTLVPESVTVDPVTVIAVDVSVVDTTRTVVGGTVSTHEVESLPLNSRSPLDLIFTLPGVSEEALSTRELAEDRNALVANTPEESGIFSLAGGPAYSNNITIDGLDNNDDRAARERFQPSLEAVEEVQIITNQFAAEYGRASGGRINIRTRGGSNTYHGRGFYFFRDDYLNANTSNNKARGLSRPPFTEHDPGFTFSGPLQLPAYDGRRKTFFFTAYEYDTILDSATIDTLVPIQQNPLFPIPKPTATDPGVIGPLRFAAGVAPFISTISTPARNHSLTTRIDHNFSDLHNASLLYQLGRQKNLRQFGGGNRLAEALLGKTRNTDAISYTDNYVVSSSLVNQTRLQFSRLAPGVAASGRRLVVLITLDDPLPASDPDRRSTLVAGSSTAGASDRREFRAQAQEILSWVHAAHSLKFGGDVQYISSTFIDLADISGTYSFSNALDFIANKPSRFRQNFQAESTQQNRYLGFFAQDDWHVLPNLFLSYGLRYEKETIIEDRNNWGPRLSVAYDPFKNGKSVIRMGAGIFYNRALLRTIDDFTLGIRQRFFDTNDLINPATGALANADFRRAFIEANLNFPQTLTVDSPLVQNFGLLNSEFSRRLDPGLRIPESYQANVGFERDVGHGFILETNYTFNRGLHLWREFNANAPRLPNGFDSFSDYLGSRDFANFKIGPFGIRPLYNAGGAGELVRFSFEPFKAISSARCAGAFNPTNADTGGCVNESGIPVTIFNLNSFSSGVPVEVALAALNGLRPDQTRADVQQLISVGNSFYNGLTFELRKHLKQTNGLAISFRSAYTFSHLTDDGIVNTSDALVAGNFFAERARSLLDRRHRFVFSGTFDMPRYLGALRFTPVVRLTSGAPFNISIGGVDRNLDDVGNDRPIFKGDPKQLRWRAPGDPIDPAILNLFSLPTIGQTGNLSRNAGEGPGQFFFDLNITREFRLSERIRLRPVIELDNLFNKTVFSFGSEFINFNSLAPTATPEQRQAFFDSFLVATRTLHPRQMRLGIRFDF